MEKELISVVVPIYNVEAYLERCLDSILSQSYPHIEVLLIDDGSPDNSGAICDDYATRDPRIVVHHIANGGVAKARQLGVESSTGEYIVFVDPDDWLPSDAVEVLYANMTSEVDVVLGGYHNVIDLKPRTSLRGNNDSVDDMLDNLLKQHILPTPWAKMYRKRLFTKSSFPQFKKSQDWLMNIEIGTRVQGIRFISDVTYYYNDCRLTSVINSYSTTIDYELSFIKICRDILTTNNKYETCKDSFANFAIYCLWRAIYDKQKVDCQDIRVREIVESIQNCNLSLKDRLRLFYIKHPHIPNIFLMHYYFLNKKRHKRILTQNQMKK